MLRSGKRILLEKLIADIKRTNSQYDILELEVFAQTAGEPTRIGVMLVIRKNNKGDLPSENIRPDQS